MVPVIIGNAACGFWLRNRVRRATYRLDDTTTGSGIDDAQVIGRPHASGTFLWRVWRYGCRRNDQRRDRPSPSHQAVTTTEAASETTTGGATSTTTGAHSVHPLVISNIDIEARTIEIRNTGVIEYDLGGHSPVRRSVVPVATGPAGRAG